MDIAGCNSRNASNFLSVFFSCIVLPRLHAFPPCLTQIQFRSIWQQRSPARLAFRVAWHWVAGHGWHTNMTYASTSWYGNAVSEVGEGSLLWLTDCCLALPLVVCVQFLRQVYAYWIVVGIASMWLMPLKPDIDMCIYIYIHTNSTAQGSGGSFKDRKL